MVQLSDMGERSRDIARTRELLDKIRSLPLTELRLANEAPPPSAD